jgi:hypothetical protein
MDTTLSRNVTEKTRRDRTRTETFRKETGIRKLLIELEEKGLQWLDHVTTMGGTGTLRRTLELEFKGRNLLGRQRTKCVRLIL